LKVLRLLGLHKLIYSKDDKRLASSIHMIVGSKPLNLSLYKLAFKHSSVAEESKNGVKMSNERLEFLGDAVLGAIVAEHLFLKYPYRDEGFLTETRSRIVNRESLNQVGQKLGLAKIVESELSAKGFHTHKSIYGDTLEALVGAVYLDWGYNSCRRFVYNRIILPHFDLDDIINTTINFKSKVIEWAQKDNHSIDFTLKSVSRSQRFKEFVVELMVDGQVCAEGMGATKKKAEQEAAKNACEKLNLSI
jgi:ribonuclease-3